MHPTEQKPPTLFRLYIDNKLYGLVTISKIRQLEDVVITREGILIYTIGSVQLIENREGTTGYEEAAKEISYY